MDKVLKSLLLEIIDDLDKVCRENNIRYYLIGGSMLGAVRHKGFIPWDDDIDVAMPREDYERFKKLAPECLLSQHKFVYGEIDNEYHYFFGKIYHQNTTLIEYADPFYVGGIFVDIFPIDGLPSNKILRNLHYWHFDQWRNLVSLAAVKNIPKDSAKNILKSTLKNFLSLPFCLKMCDKLASVFPFGTSDLAVNYGGAWRKKEITRHENFAEGVDCEFEGRTLRIPVGYENILREVYGDYMKLPPKEKQVSHHSHYYVNLERRLKEDEIEELSAKS